MSEYRRGRKQSTFIEGREVLGVTVGIIVMAILVAISYFLGGYMFALGTGGVVMGLTLAGAFGYAYSALNRRRRYDYVLFVMIAGYLIGAYIVELFLPEGQVLVNLATVHTAVAWIVYMLYFLVILVLMGAAFFYAKRTDLR